jgi:diguanylate cyclase (GGDEF)-like protein
LSGFRTLTPPSLQPLHGAVSAAILGTALSILAFFAVSSWEGRLAERTFAETAKDHTRALQQGLDEYTDRLVGLRALFNASRTGVTREEFAVFSQDLMRERKGLLSMSWTPRVLDAEREAHERAARRDGIPDYRISAIDANGDKAGPSPKSEDYYPIFYSTQPREARSYGVDLQDGGVRQRALDVARDNDALAATKNFRLQSGVGDKPIGFFAVLPVYKPDLPHATLEERRRNIAGFVRGSFQFDMVADAVLSSVNAPVNFFLFESGADRTQLPVYVSKDGTKSEDRVAKGYVMAERPKWVGDLRVGDRHWEAVAIPSISAPNLARYNRAWIVLVAGLLITGLVAAYVWTSTRYVRMLEAANEAVSELARTDALTGLANRRSFVERLSLAFASAARGEAFFAVHFLDLDGFKAVNDSHGHAMGDALLQDVAARLRRLVRASDLVARFGGDEFAMLQGGIASPASASAFAAKVIKELSAPYNIGGVELHVTASLGIALHGSKADGPAGVMMQADLALYAAKAAGRNRFRIYSADLDQEPRRHMENGVRHSAA